jgi:hypothetical protein
LVAAYADLLALDEFVEGLLYVFAVVVFHVASQ